MLAAVRKFLKTCFPECCDVRENCGESEDESGLEMTECKSSAAQTGSSVNTQLTSASAPSVNVDTSAVTEEIDDDDATDGGDDVTLESGGATGHPSPCTSEDSAAVIDDFFEDDEEGFHSEGVGGNRDMEFTGGARADAVNEDDAAENNVEEDDVEEKVTVTSQRNLGGFQQE